MMETESVNPEESMAENELETRPDELIIDAEGR